MFLQSKIWRKSHSDLFRQWAEARRAGQLRRPHCGRRRRRRRRNEWLYFAGCVRSPGSKGIAADDDDDVGEQRQWGGRARRRVQPRGIDAPTPPPHVWLSPSITLEASSRPTVQNANPGGLSNCAVAFTGSLLIKEAKRSRWASFEEKCAYLPGRFVTTKGEL